MSYYRTGGLSFADASGALQKALDKFKATVRTEAAKGAAPAAKKSVTPIVVGAVALSALSLAVALRR